MSHKLLFSASLRVRHPSLEAKDIIERVGLVATTAQSVGASRKTKKGGTLNGIYHQTYVSFLLDTKGLDYPEDFIDGEMSKPYLADNLGFSHILKTGGEVEFFLGLHCKGNEGFSFSSTLIENLAKKGISVAFDVYGGEWD